MTAFILSVLVLLGLGGIVYGIHAISAELRGLNGADAASKTEQERRDEKTRKDIEKWREGK